MASGKSTIGKLLAKNLGYDFADLDNYIENAEERTIKEIFSESGEIYFRKKETYYLNEIINSKSSLVLSLGGGTPCYANNMDVINGAENTTSIYLKASIDTIKNRLTNGKAKRPLIAHLKSNDDLVEFIGKHLFERTQYYNQSDITIAADNKSKNEIVEEIVLELF